jgi:PAS domain S-box-containing protein
MAQKITYAHLFASTSNGVIATDANGHIVLINHQAATILNLDEKGVIDSHIRAVLPMTGRLFTKCLESGESQLGRHIVGKKISLVVSVTPILEDQRILGAMANFEKMQDFEDSAQQLESYRRLNVQLEAIFKSSSDGIWLCDGNGKIININGASEKINAIRAKDIVGKNVREIVEEGLVDRSATLEVLETQRQVSLLQYLKKTNKYLLVTGTPVFDEDGHISLVVVNERDMTQLNLMKEKLAQTRMETQRFKDELVELSLSELKDQEVIAKSDEMRQVLRVAVKLAKMEASNILILGETGTGKGLLAKFIHQYSHRKKKPFIQINCAALPETLLEAELFGYEKGAFTGAREHGKIGLFELAHEGTLFLDEIGDLPLSVQAKLLKYLDDHEIMRLGGIKPKQVDCIIIAATNRNLEARSRQRKFRQDLFFRLNTFVMQIPPLRARPDDILELANHLLDKYNRQYTLKRRISPSAKEQIKSYAFPGNVRELKNIIKMAVMMSENDSLDDYILRNLKTSVLEQSDYGQTPGGQMSLIEETCAFEKRLLQNAMTNVKTTREMAGFLGINQSTVVRKMKKHDLAW